MKTTFVKKLSLAGVTVAALLCNMQQAQAAMVGQANTWTLQGVTFADGGTASGTFSVDSFAQLTSYDITTTTIGSISGYSISGYHYISDSGRPSYSAPYDIQFYSEGNISLFEMYFVSATDTSATSSQIKLSSNSIYESLHGSREDYLSLSRKITGGSITSIVSATPEPGSAVPEPGTCATLLASLGLMGFMLRRRKTL